MSNKFIYSLLIDTSSVRSIISLNKNDTPISFRHLELNKDFSSSLFPSIKELLEKNGLLPADLSFIAVGTGPGSYTGIRVGAASAKSISYALDIPIIAFCSLKCFVPSSFSPFYSVLNAKSGGIYLLEGEKNKNNVFYPNKPILLSISEAHLYLKKSHILISPHMEELKEKLQPFISLENCVYGYPDPFHLSELTFDKYKNSNFTLSNKLQLLYLGGPNPIDL
jgi:tRNA threonylcarbamoyladenosine biosynthesis protein TsaB